MTHIFFDCEADGLRDPWALEPATAVGAVVAELVTPQGQTLEFPEFDDGLIGIREHLPEQGRIIVVGHNIIDYDLPVLQRFNGWDYDILPDRLQGYQVQFVDTLILSKLLHSDRQLPDGFTEQWKPQYQGHRLPGPHSLEVWAYRLGLTKPALVYGENMGSVPVSVLRAQARADVEITRAVYYALMEEARRFNLKLHEPLKCEQAVRHIITKGAMHGVLFDRELAEESIPDLDQKMAEIAAEVEPLLPRIQLPKSKLKFPPKSRFKRDGTPHANALKYFGEALQKVDDKWTVVLDDEKVLLKDWPEDRPFGESTVPCTMANQAEIKQWLMDVHGWRPTYWNTNSDGEFTSPKFSAQGALCDHLEQIAENIPEVRLIVQWLSYRSRRNVILSNKGTGWLRNPRLEYDGRISSDADTLGTATHRFTHRVVVNVPRVSTLYGDRMRAMFKASEGHKLVGWDAKALEDRCKAHYTLLSEGGEEYAQKLLDPDFDVHSENAENWGMERNATKNGHYAIQYGCKPPKLAETLGIPLEEAEKYWFDWWARNRPLEEFNEKLKAVWELEYNREFVPGIDGRLIPTRKQSALANTVFQSAGVIAMKYAMVWWYTQVRKLGIPAVQVIHYHDEAQAECPPEYAEQVGELGVQSIRWAGKKLGFRVPLDSDYKIGDSWAETH